ncbi:hypothetical protein MMC21_002210 [Puttea exsequens]|nr:hypothetical protein [Puttea exsequens]
MCFLRINTSTAPLNPPGAAPTLTTIYDEAKEYTYASTSTTTSPSDSLSKDPKDPPSTKISQKKKHRFSLTTKPAPASNGLDDATKSEKKRTQEIADSLDLGGDLEAMPEREGDGKRRKGSEGVSVGGGMEMPNRVIGMGQRRKSSLVAQMPMGKRRSVG